MNKRLFALTRLKQDGSRTICVRSEKTRFPIGRLGRAMFLAVCLTALAHDASANNGKNYPASSCVAWSGSLVLGAWSTIENTSGSNWLGVDCPGIKDENTAPVSGSYIRVSEHNSTDNASCELYAGYTYLNSIYSVGSGAKNTSGVSGSINPFFQQLDFGGLYPVLNDMYYVIGCWIPPNGSNPSKVGVYHIEEG